jgi:hypothetical protein
MHSTDLQYTGPVKVKANSLKRGKSEQIHKNNMGIQCFFLIFHISTSGIILLLYFFFSLIPEKMLNDTQKSTQRVQTQHPNFLTGLPKN